METVEYGKFGKCARLANEEIELLVTTEIGPRVIRLGFDGQENEFAELDVKMDLPGGDYWNLYGGHRLWHSPESNPRSYAPDNSPIEARREGSTLRLTSPPEAMTGIQKEMEIALDQRRNHVTVLHRLRNTSVWPVELAPWALSVMAPGGKALVPLSDEGVDPDRLLPNSALTLWPYTNMADPCVRWGRKYITVCQGPTTFERWKIGLHNTLGWAAYWRHGHLFLKQYLHCPGAEYPDFGSSTEVFTCPEMLELETLGPLKLLDPDEATEHIEEWQLFRDVDLGEDDESLSQAVLPKLLPD